MYWYNVSPTLWPGAVAAALVKPPSADINQRQPQSSPRCDAYIDTQLFWQLRADGAAAAMLVEAHRWLVRDNGWSFVAAAAKPPPDIDIDTGMPLEGSRTSEDSG